MTSRKEITQLKMGYRSKQRLLKRASPDGWKTLKEMLNIISHYGNAYESTLRFHFAPVKMSKNNKINASLCWGGSGVRRTFICC